MGARRSDLDQLPTAFVDSSVFFTAVNSPTGGSAKLFSGHGKRVRLLVSPIVLAETERNVRAKLEDFHLERFFRLAGRIEIIDQSPDDRLIGQAGKVIVKKDAVILAAAVKAETDYVATLDVNHFMTGAVFEFAAPAKVMTPGEVLKALV